MYDTGATDKMLSCTCASTQVCVISFGRMNGTLIGGLISLTLSETYAVLCHI